MVARSRNRIVKSRPGPQGAQEIPCESCPLRQMETFRKFTKEELAFISNFKIGEMTVQAGSTIFLEGHNSPHLFTVLDGWAMRFKILQDGNRQVFNFAFRGDLLGLQSALFDKMLHSVEALTDMRLCVFPRERIWELYHEQSNLAYDMTWMAAREESILAQHLAAVGQMPALGRIAYLIVFLLHQVRRGGRGNESVISAPITQEHIGDAMGLSLVHTNKTIRKLQAMGCIEWQRQVLRVLDEKRLIELSGYDRQEREERPFL
ncbi:MAG: Crp/Fnr family transcriptional regulator [Hyphomicrobiaceae bacterium]